MTGVQTCALPIFLFGFVLTGEAVAIAAYAALAVIMVIRTTVFMLRVKNQPQTADDNSDGVTGLRTDLI